MRCIIGRAFRALSNTRKENCYHQITYANFNLKVYDPPSYEWKVWHYQMANIGNIRKAIREFPWERRFANSNINEKVYLVYKTTYIPLIFLMKQSIVMTEIHLGLIKI